MELCLVYGEAPLPESGRILGALKEAYLARWNYVEYMERRHSRKVAHSRVL